MQGNTIRRDDVTEGMRFLAIPTSYKSKNEKNYVGAPHKVYVLVNRYCFRKAVGVKDGGLLTERVVPGSRDDMYVSKWVFNRRVTQYPDARCNVTHEEAMKLLSE